MSPARKKMNDVVITGQTGVDVVEMPLLDGQPGRAADAGQRGPLGEQQPSERTAQASEPAAHVQTRMSLWDVEQRLAGILDRLEELQDAGVESSDELDVVANEYLTAAMEKRDACAFFLRQCERSELALKTEITLLSQRLKRRVAARERFEAYILETMQKRAMVRIDGNASSFAIVKNPQHVAIDPDADPADVAQAMPSLVRHTPESWDFDKKAIADVLKAGQHVPFAWMADGGVRLKVT